MTLKKNLGKRIQTLRKQKKFTQDKFAELIGIDPKSVSKIENGNNYPSPETISSIAKALNVNIYELFVFQPEPDYEEMKREIINSLDDKQKILYIYKILKCL